MWYHENVKQGPTLVRLSWHSSGSHDQMSKTAGSGKGTMRFKEELAHGGDNHVNIFMFHSGSTPPVPGCCAADCHIDG